MLPADLLGFHLYPLDQTQSGNPGLVPAHPFTHTYSRAAGIPAPGQASCFSPKKVPATFFLIQCNQDAHMSGHLQIRLLLEGVHMRTLVTPVKSEMLLHPRWASSNWSERLRLS